jgi:hypothetical protein
MHHEEQDLFWIFIAPTTHGTQRVVLCNAPFSSNFAGCQSLWYSYVHLYLTSALSGYLIKFSHRFDWLTSRFCLGLSQTSHRTPTTPCYLFSLKRKTTVSQPTNQPSKQATKQATKQPTNQPTATKLLFFWGSLHHSLADSEPALRDSVTPCSLVSQLFVSMFCTWNKKNLPSSQQIRQLTN